MEPSEEILPLIFQEIDDEQQARLKELFTAQGRGRRPNPPDFKMKATNRLLLQVYSLKVLTDGKWHNVDKFMSTLFPYLPQHKIRPCIETAVRGVQRAPDRNIFYEQVIDFNEIGPACTRIGLTHDRLTEPADGLPLTTLTRDVLLELDKAFKADLHAVVNQVWPNSFTPEKIKKELASTKKTFQMKNKTTSRKHEATLYLQEVVPCPVNDTPEDSSSSQQYDSQNKRKKDRSDPKGVKQLEKGLEDLTKQRDNLVNESAAFREMYDQKCKELDECEKKMNTLDDQCIKYKACVESLESTISAIESKFQDVSSELRDIKSTARFKRFRRKESNLDKKEIEMNRHLDDETSAQIQLAALKKENEKVKRKLRSTEEKLYNVIEQKGVAVKEAVALKLECASLESELLHLKSEKFTTRSDSPSHPYLEKIEKCMMLLAGEIEIPSTKCSQTVQAVVKCLFDIDIPLEDLPSTSTINTMVDRAHVLSKIQLSESVTASKRWDLHGDGTTRDHKKIIGQQITLDSGKVLSAGFRHVSQENSNTLLDNTIAMIEELADVYEDDEKEAVYKDILNKMFAVMSDRASVNKAFNEKLSNHRRTVLQGKEHDLHYLYCNAHFLLGLSTAAENILKAEVKAIENDIGPIGRDGVSKFQHFKSSGESGPSRYVRTACDVLGPRGDEKNGCKDDWDAYCETIGVKSEITSFRMNRFNNFFQGAAGLYHHQQNIINFLNDYKENRNLKLESVLYDAMSKELQAIVRALGILFYKITGPFWNMLQGDVQYVDQYIYIQRMLESFKEWATDSSDLLTQDGCVFPEFSVKNDDVAQSVFTPNPAMEEYTKRALEKIIEQFVEVTERQLGDFLVGGKYGAAPSAETREQMKHCKLTNLVSEHEFGHLDFSQFRRRHASMFYHSGIQMIKQNKTISSWLLLKTREEQTQLLRQAHMQSAKMREKYLEAERNVLRQTQERLHETNRKKVEREARKMKEKQVLISKVEDHGGPCKTPDDITRLLAPIKTEKAKLDALKSEASYLKVILGVANKRLVFAKKKSKELAEDLKFVLSLMCQSEAMPEALPTEKELTINTPENGSKKRKATTSRTSKSRIVEKTPVFERYKFTRQGSWVAIAYEENYFVGTVLEIESPEKALIQFLQKGAYSNFRYPRVDDIALIKSEFVFAHDFEVTSTNGRTWTIEDLDCLVELYQQYVDIYFKSQTVECVGI